MSKEEKLNFKALSPDGLVFDKGEIINISIPLVDGSKIGIRPGHAPLIAATGSGVIHYISDTEEADIQLLPGILIIRDNLITILTAGLKDDSSEIPFVQTNSDYERLMDSIIETLIPEIL